MATLLKLNEDTVTLWIRKGELPAHRLGGKLWRIRLDDLRTYLAKRGASLETYMTSDAEGILGSPDLEDRPPLVAWLKTCCLIPEPNAPAESPPIWRDLVLKDAALSRQVPASLAAQIDRFVEGLSPAPRNLWLVPSDPVYALQLAAAVYQASTTPAVFHYLQSARRLFPPPTSYPAEEIDLIFVDSIVADGRASRGTYDNLDFLLKTRFPESRRVKLRPLVVACVYYTQFDPEKKVRIGGREVPVLSLVSNADIGREIRIWYDEEVIWPNVGSTGTEPR